MSVKIYDGKGRWRNKMVSFRVSPEEDVLIEKFVSMSGLNKRAYIVERLLHKDIVVIGNPRVYKALRNQLAEVLDELKRIDEIAPNADLLEVIEQITITLQGLKEESL